jgi:hypothetical protein
MLVSVITCPVCGYQSEVKMPESSCLYFWECEACNEIISPEKGDCCVFCSFGDNPCPPVQMEDSGEIVLMNVICTICLINNTCAFWMIKNSNSDVA